MGDLIQFLVEFKNYSYSDAFKAAGRYKPKEYPPKYRQPSFQILKKSPLENKLRVFNEPCSQWKEKAFNLVRYANETILQTDDSLDYLDSRGIDPISVKNFHLGWFPGEKGKGCIYRPRSSWGLPPIKRNDGREKKLWIPRGIVIPCFKNGQIYRIRIRRPKQDIMTPHDVRYYVMPGSGMEAMVLNSDRKAFVVVESELDGFLIARKASSLVGVVALGNAQGKPGSGVFPYLKNALKILVALDWDTAGKNAWPWWRDNFDNSKLWPVPVGKDPGEAYEKGIDIKKWILAGLPPVFHLNTRADESILKNINPPKGLYPLQELRYLLKRLPIKIIADRNRHEIVFDSGFKNKEIINRIKQLFFEDEEVFYYLKLIHPETIIHGSNFDFKNT